MKNESKKIKIKGIPFGVLLAGKVADGTKTVTRRVVAINGNPVLEPIEIEEADSGFVYNRALGNFPVTGALPCPYTVGQLLYVREPWRVGNVYDKPSGSDHILNDATVDYLSDKVQIGMLGRRRIARFMPARFARTFLRVTEVRCERLGEITEVDAVREGIDVCASNDLIVLWRDYSGKVGFSSPTNSFFSLWDSINGKDSHLQNPWVWVISFVKVEMPNPWNEEKEFAWGWKKAMVGYVSDACAGLLLQVVPDMATGLVVGFLNETNLGDFKTYPSAQLACQAAAMNHYLGIAPKSK